MDLQNQNHVGHQCSDYELEPRSADYHAVSQEEILQDDADAVSPLEEPLEAVTHAIIEQQEQESLQTGTHTVSQQQDVIRDDMDGVSQQEEPLQNITHHQKLHKDNTHAVKSPKSSIASLDDWCFLELLALLCSAGLLIAIIVILLQHDNRPQPA